MTTEPNNSKLKLAIARMLPEQIDIFWRNDEPFFLWKRQDPDVGDAFVLETEWLYIVSLVEQQLGPNDLADYEHLLTVEFGFIKGLTATFNQRATALCKVKGITIE